MRDVRIATPCELDWRTLPADGLDRHCPTCARKVHDLSARTEGEARALLILSSGTRLCARFESAPDGTPRSRGAAPVAAAAALSALVGCGAPASAAGREPPATIALPNVAPTGDASGPRAPLAVATAAPSASSPPDVAPPDAKPRVVVENMGVVVIPLVVFEKGSPRLDASTDAVLDEIAAALARTPTITLLEVSGHTSSDEPAPDTLGTARANAVIDALVKRGVDRGRLVARSAGATEPVDANTTAAGRARNRRVTFRVVTTP
jgi:outer membrane protein OmpA-like peptidoglycan-associated protein